MGVTDSHGLPSEEHLVRRPRFSRPLKSTGVSVEIPSKWDLLPTISSDQHENIFLQILSKHGIAHKSPVPLVGRYSHPRPWSSEELFACIDAHERRVPIGLMSAALNRNPQDIIYRLLDVCHSSGVAFCEVGMGSERWTPKVKEIARELFDAGLTAWRIAAFFGVDFEGIEKKLYLGRADYGHVKRNPFAICTDHKQEINRDILQGVEAEPSRVLDAFAGEGRFAGTVEDLFPSSSLVCLEQDAGTFERALALRPWRPQTRWVLGNNIAVMKELFTSGQRFEVVDLDPFVSCREQIDFTWQLLNKKSLLFVTFGGEYRRSFIRTNRIAIQRRYGFYDSVLSNSEYLEIVPSFFLGWLASQAAVHSFVFRVERCVRYPNNCRFWLSLSRQSRKSAAAWLERYTRSKPVGIQWRNLEIPRFSELRKLQRSAKKRITPSSEQNTPSVDSRGLEKYQVVREQLTLELRDE